MKRIRYYNLKPGDIILTASPTKTGKAIQLATQGKVSHAIICVQYSSIIDSTSEGVQARNLQREFFEDADQIFAFRMKDKQPDHVIAKIVDFARSEIGTRYSTSEAIRTALGGGKPRNKREFCSRLVARAYHSAGIQLVPNKDYCSPEDLRVCPLLLELEEIWETVSDDEVTRMESLPNPLAATRDAQNAVLNAARELDQTVESFQDLDQLVRGHPEWDSLIAQAYRDSGYLEIWKHEVRAYPWRYDLDAMNDVQTPSNLEELRSYCIATIREAYSGGARYSANLVHYQVAQEAEPRETLELLIDLYKTLVHYDSRRRNVAQAWLDQHYPGDVKQHMERIEPHSELWFSMIDRVAPPLGVCARAAIKSRKSIHVCSSCGDEPVNDYRIVNAGEAMHSVPSLRLCDDCCSIRSDLGEKLELLC